MVRMRDGPCRLSGYISTLLFMPQQTSFDVSLHQLGTVWFEAGATTIRQDSQLGIMLWALRPSGGNLS